MEQSELLAWIVGVFDRLKLEYFITGSVATSYFGEPRFTNDIDVIVELTLADVSRFCQSFPNEEFYLSEAAVQDAVHKRRQFNILHPTTGLKVDVFVFDKTPFEQSRLSRRRRLELQGGGSAWFASPEDTVLKKNWSTTKKESPRSTFVIFLASS